MNRQHLQLELLDPVAHLLKATLVIQSAQTQTLTLAFARWIPGSYLLRDFARHIIGLSATNAKGDSIELTRLDLSRWQFKAPAGEVHIHYQLYAYDASVRANYFCPSYAFINPAATAFFIEEWRDHPYQLSLRPSPQHSSWQVDTTLTQVNCDKDGFGLYQATNFDDLIEHPLLISAGKRIDWMVDDMPHRMVFVDEAPLSDIDENRLIADLTAICSAQHDFWAGKKPYDRYLFQVMVSQDGYGGLEHNQSTALMTSRKSLPRYINHDSAAYEDYLGLCSHEYFHSWLVKRIKPHNLIQPIFHDAPITPLLWIFEGFTSLYDDWFLFRSGLIHYPALLKRWGDTLTRTLTTQGGQWQSLAQASEEAWIKFYQPHENSANTTVSYYTRGAAVALLLWQQLAQQGQHLDDLLKHWWQQWQNNDYQGLSPSALIDDLTNICPSTNWAEWLDRIVHEPTPDLIQQLSQALAYLGVQISEENTFSLGVAWQENNGIWVKQVSNNGPAHRAGLQVGDELIAINGWRINQKSHIDTWLQNAQANAQPLQLTINHKGYLQTHWIMPTALCSKIILQPINEQPS